MNEQLIPSPNDPQILEIKSAFVAGKSGNLTIDNFLLAMRHDTAFEKIRFNEMTNTAEVKDVTDPSGIKYRKWNDTDEAYCRSYLEFVYGLYSREKFIDALRIFLRERRYNPLTDIIDNLVWDGKERCGSFLTKWAKADDNDYTHEVSRLIFAGGINRLYHPGCKFDDVPILIGTKQGEGKSSLIRFLAINDSFYGECSRMDGQEAIEQLSGKWIMEISEMLAMTRQKEQEAVKAYITRAVDSYRIPYDRNVAEFPRKVIFIGTTNNANPLVDKTGNRRFYPVKVKCNGYELFDHEAEVREYILQCWAEARAKLDTSEMQAFAKRELGETFAAKQEDAMQDDSRLGLIMEYLSSKSKGDYTCVIELKCEALNVGSEFPQMPSMQESKDISMMMNKIPGWEQLEGKRSCGKYGPQKAWMKTDDSVFKVDDDDEECDYNIPFL